MSLRSRLVLAVAVIAVVALLAADVATYSALRSFLDSRTDQALQQSAASLPLGIGHQPAGGQGSLGQEPVDSGLGASRRRSSRPMRRVRSWRSATPPAT
jgi:hypothetical protein